MTASASAADLYAQGWTLRQIGAELGDNCTFLRSDIAVIQHSSAFRTLKP